MTEILPPNEEEVLGKVYDRHLVRRLLRYLRPYRWRVVSALVLALIVSALTLLQPLLVLRFIDHTVPNRDLREFAMILGAFVVLMLLEYVVRYAYTLVVNSTGQLAIFDLRMELFRHLQGLSLSFFDRSPVGRLMTRVLGDIEVLNELFSQGVTTVFGSMLMLVGILGILLWLSPALTLVALLVTPLMVLVSYLFRKYSRKGFRAVRTRIARLNTYLQENITGLTTVQAFAREKLNQQEFSRLNKEHYQANIETILAFSIFFPSVEIVSALGVGAILWYGGLRVQADYLSLGVLIAFIEYLHKFFEPIRELSAQYGILQSAMASAERIFKLLDQGAVVVDSPDARVPDNQDGTIRFENVSFGYQEKEPVIKDISFSIQSGEKFAFVGATGSGKTTIMSLLCRLYDIQQGTIYVDGQDIRQWPQKNLRRKFGLVLQDVFLFSGNVYDNITLGEPNITHEMVHSVCQELGIEPFIKRLPEGYSTPLGERGRSLSVGERQLISFARALAHNPDVLILDEATASIDTETERMIQQALERLIAGRTSLIVAHRLSTIQNCDQILVLHHGRIVERGSHFSLLDQGGFYSRLYELQFKNHNNSSHGSER